MKQNFKKKLQEFFTLSTFAKIIGIAIIVVSTIAPSLFDPENADWRKVLNNFLLATVIVVTAFISQNASAKARGYEEDDYKKSKDNHESKYHEIQNRSLSYFHGLYVKDSNKKNKTERVKEIFSNYEIPYELYECSEKDLKTAYKEQLINKEQLSVVHLCRQGKIDYDKYDVRDLTTSRIVKKFNNKNKSQEADITWSNLIGKLSWVLAFAIIWGMFVWDEAAAEDGIHNGQAWLDLAGRLFQFVGGLWAGETNGKAVCEDDIRLYNQFYNFNSTFIQEFDNSIWQPSPEDRNDNILEKIHKLQRKEDTTINLPQVCENSSYEPKNSQNEEFQEIEITEEEFKKLQEEKKI